MDYKTRGLQNTRFIKNVVYKNVVYKKRGLQKTWFTKNVVYKKRGL
jgi:hypothetical protein